MERPCTPQIRSIPSPFDLLPIPLEDVFELAIVLARIAP
jgi:hypothetical protein